MIDSPGALVPVIGVRGAAFLAVQVGMDGYTICGFQLVYQCVGASPILFCIPPQRR